MAEQAGPLTATAPAQRSGAAAFRRAKNLLFGSAAGTAAGLVLLTIAAIGYRLFAESSESQKAFGLSFLSGADWDVPHGIYGALPFIYGTVVSSLLAILIAVPVSLGASIFLNEMRIGKISKPIRYFMELLAAIPSVIYGFWAVTILCPFLDEHLTPWLTKNAGFLPFFQGTPAANNMLAAGVILSVMISPFIISVVTEVFRSLPTGLREASLALGGNRWETIRSVVLPASRGGILAAVMLGLGRALGETMAVAMVIGNNPQIKASLLEPAYSMPSLLANEFNEAYSDKLHLSALMEIGLLLFAITVLVNAFARGLVRISIARGAGSQTGVVQTVLNQAFAGIIRVAGSALLVGFVLADLYQATRDLRDFGTGMFQRPAFLVAALAAICLYLRTAKLRPSWIDPIRRMNQRALLGACISCGFLACAVLAIVLSYIAVKGSSGLSLNIFTQLPRPPGMAGGGLRNAIIGTFELVGIAALIGVPIGVMGGVFLAEYRMNRLCAPFRFAADVLGGIPSVVVGLFAYAVFVLPFHHFSALAGSLALSIMMIPTVMRITEEILRLVPDALREASQGLGATRAETIFKVILPAAKGGIVTGVMLAVARISGETAPLLFTAFGSDQINWDPREPASSLTMQIYYYAKSPSDDWIAQAWAGALVLVTIVLATSLLARIASAQTSSRFASFKRS